jgi:hypothetical protein
MADADALSPEELPQFINLVHALSSTSINGDSVPECSRSFGA